jgi:hypothetical protein
MPSASRSHHGRSVTETLASCLAENAAL